MGFLKSLKSLFGCDHDYRIINVTTKDMRAGTMIVHLSCEKCDSQMDTFHDITETKYSEFRHPLVEELLLKQGYIKTVKMKGKPVFRQISSLAEQMQKKFVMAYLKGNAIKNIKAVEKFGKVSKKEWAKILATNEKGINSLIDVKCIDKATDKYFEHE